MVQPVAKQSRKRGGAGRVVLIVLGAVGIVAGLLLWFLAGSRYDDAVQSLAPAPVACETTLEFDDAGTYLFFVETKGDVGEIEGSCAATDRDYDYDGDALPRVSLTLVDDGGEEVDLDRVSEPSYDHGGRAGTAVRTAEIDDAGTYLLTVEANDPDVMIRVGKDPQQGVGAMRVSGIVLAVLGLVALILGLVRRPPQAGRRHPERRPALLAARRWSAPGRPAVRPPARGAALHPRTAARTELGFAGERPAPAAPTRRIVPAATARPLSAAASELRGGASR